MINLLPEPPSSLQDMSSDSSDVQKIRPQKKDKTKSYTKVIIRRLPPTMTEEEFLKQIAPLPEHDVFYYAAADWSLGLDATCRAYVNFRKHDDVFLFRDRFDGYVFVDSKGEEYAAVVEFAPFQGLSKNKPRKSDTKVNTIGYEVHYIDFLQKLQAEREAVKSESKIEFSLQPKPEKKVEETPLLQYLKSKRRDDTKKRVDDSRRKRDEERQKRRNKAAKNNSGSNKDEKEKDSKQKDNVEEKKMSKRRAERNQRRREEHEQRRREKEMEKERAAQDEGKNQEKDEKVSANAENKNTGDAKKEVKKYSERRDRNRSKNSHNKGEANQNDTAEKMNAKSEKPQPKIILMKNPLNSSRQQQETAKTEKVTEDTSSKSSVIQIQKREDKVENSVADDWGSKQQQEKWAEAWANNWNEAEEKSDALYYKDVDDSKNDDRSDKRIRNKDRPSIVIYQPGKTRLRPSDEPQSSSEAKTNPPSDSESSKKEERPNALRKVSRYSEKRSGRATEPQPTEQVQEQVLHECRI